jgi:hypothetical protein
VKRNIKREMKIAAIYIYIYIYDEEPSGGTSEAVKTVLRKTRRERWRDK